MSVPGGSRKLTDPSDMGFGVVVYRSAVLIGGAERSYLMFCWGTPDK